MCLLKCLSEKLTAWNKDMFKNIFKQKRRLRRRLEGVEGALDERTSVGLLKLESKLKKEWAEVLLQKELLWLQKSRIDWLRLGDRNTKFFHTIMLVRNRRNKVEALKNGEGDWITDSDKLKV